MANIKIHQRFFKLLYQSKILQKRGSKDLTVSLLSLFVQMRSVYNHYFISTYLGKEDLLVREMQEGVSAGKAEEVVHVRLGILGLSSVSKLNRIPPEVNQFKTSLWFSIIFCMKVFWQSGNLRMVGMSSRNSVRNCLKAL